MYPAEPVSLASQKLKFRLVFTIGMVLIAEALTWLILGESSPFHSYFLWHTALPNIWRVTVFLPYMVSAVITGNLHAPSIVLFVLASTVQWGVFGYLLSGPFANLFIRYQKR